MLTRYFILFCLAGIIELFFLGLGVGTSVFSVFAALTIIFISMKILGSHFVNGRIIRLAVAFSMMYIVLGNIPIAVAEKADRLKPLEAEFSGGLLSMLSVIFRGPLDHYVFFWLGQSFIFTSIFIIVFLVFSKLLRRIDNGVSSRTLQNQNS